jgi:hypothetical protein
LSQVDVPNILIVWFIDMIFIGIAASVQSLIVDRFERFSVLRGIILLFIAAYGLLRIMFLLPIPEVVNYAILFLLVEQQWIFFPLVFWVLATDIFQLPQAKRLFPLIAAFSFTGQILGLLLASAAPGLLARLNLTTADTLLFNVVLYIIAEFILFFGLKKPAASTDAAQPKAVEPIRIRETINEGIGFVRDVPSFTYLTVTMLMVAIAVTIVDFHFLFVLDRSFADAAPGSFQTFYAAYRLVVTVLSILVQTLVTSRLIENFRLKNVFTLLPLFILASLGLMALPLLMAVVAGRGLFRVVQSSVDEPSRKAFLSLVPDNLRGRVSVFLDSYVFVSGVMIGCVLMGILILVFRQSPLVVPLYLGLAALAACVALWASLNIRKVYDSSLLNWRLKKRRINAGIMDKLNFD